jgi:glycosyltransferase involved in cell wall biosynthesis
MCGWAIQTKLVTEELRRRGHVCEVLKINEGRQIKSVEYIDVQDGADYLRKICSYSLRGYRLNVHVNGMSRKGYWLAFAAALTGRLFFRPALLTFHGGLSQDYFPRHDNSRVHWAFYVLFLTAGAIACDSRPIEEAIEGYGIASSKVETIATFSPQYLKYAQVQLPDEAETFLRKKRLLVFSYLAFRPEYRLDVLREGMKLYRKAQPYAGFIWLGFPEKELLGVKEYVSNWPAEEREGLLLLGSLTHDQFLTLLSRCFIYLRTPACDGVAASVLESIALGVPVVASENRRRPDGVVTYNDMDAVDMSQKLIYVTQHYNQVKASLRLDAGADNVGRMADWLAGESVAGAKIVPAR